MKIDLYKSRYYAPAAAAGQAPAATAEEIDDSDRGDALAAEAYAEMDGTALPKKKEPVDDAVEPPAQEPAPEAPEPPPEGQEPAAEVPAEGEQPKAETPAAPVEITEDVINAHAQKQGMTFAQAKADLEEAAAVLEKYKKDPVELAKALRNTQREYDRLKNQGQKPADTSPRLLTDAELKADVNAYAAKNADKIVAKYRQEMPNRTVEMTDEAILEWAKDDAVKNYRANAAGELNRLKTAASTRREALLSDIPAEEEGQSNAKYMHDVKLLLAAATDQEVLDPDYRAQEVLWSVRGQRAPAEIKAAYERGLRAGREEPKILGVTPGSNAGNPVKKPAAVKTSLSAQQKQMAYDQFPDSGEVNAEKLWADLYADDLKKNPHYLPNE